MIFKPSTIPTPRFPETEVLLALSNDPLKMNPAPTSAHASDMNCAIIIEWSVLSN